MTPSLLVLRVMNLAANREFYSRLGFSFTEEKHGNGPIHLSSAVAGMVIELYACRENESPSNVRLGFRFQKSEENVAQARKRVEDLSGSRYVDPDGYDVFVILDPDNRKLEIGFEK